MKGAPRTAAGECQTIVCPSGNVPPIELPDTEWSFVTESVGVKIAEVPAFHAEKGTIVQKMLPLRPSVRQKNGTFTTVFSLALDTTAPQVTAIFQHTDGRIRRFILIRQP